MYDVLEEKEVGEVEDERGLLKDGIVGRARHVCGKRAVGTV